jgi:hypothetical protein
MWPYPIMRLVVFALLLGSFAAHGAINWRVFPSAFPTEDVIVAAISGDDVALDKTGATDMTSPLQALANEVYLAGGGTIFLPQGIYRVDGSVTVKAGVTFRGEWQKPTPVSPITGTIIQVTRARAGQGLAQDGTFKLVGHASAVRDLAFWYPDQLFTNLVSYPPSIQVTKISGYRKPQKATVLNVTLVNSFHGIYWGPGSSGNPNMINIYGTVLKTGVRSAGSFGGQSRFHHVDFSPDYWSGSGLPGSPPSGGAHATFMRQKGIASDGYTFYLFSRFDGFHTGIRSADGTFPEGDLYQVTITNCDVAAEFSTPAGDRMLIQDCHFHGSQAAVNFVAGFNMPNALFHTVEFNGRVRGTNMSGSARFLRCAFRDGVALDPDTLNITDCEFSFAAGNASKHLVIGTNTTALVFGNRFQGAPNIAASAKTAIDHMPFAARPLPVFDYDAHHNPVRKPGTTNLFIVTQPPFSADKTGSHDCTAAVQAAINAASGAGGGIVFFPAGDYLVTNTVTVKPGVELRGLYGAAHSNEADGRERGGAYVGSLLHIEHGRGSSNGPATFTLEGRSGVRGLSVRYAQDFKNLTAFPYTFRGNGPDIYLIDVAVFSAFNFLDLGTHRCDNHLVDLVYWWSLNEGIRVGAGSTNGRIQRVLSKQGDMLKAEERNLETYGADFRTPCLAGDVTNQLFLSVYSRGANSLIHTLPDQHGPDLLAIDFGGEAQHNFIIATTNARDSVIRAVFVDSKVNRGTDHAREKAQVHAVFNQPATGEISIWNGSLKAAYDTTILNCERANVLMDNCAVGGNEMTANQNVACTLTATHFTDPLELNAADAGFPPLNFIGSYFTKGVYVNPAIRSFTAERTSALSTNTRVFLRHCIAPRGMFAQVINDGVIKERGLSALVNLPGVSAHTFAEKNYFAKEKTKAMGKELWYFTLAPTNLLAPTKSCFDVTDPLFTNGANTNVTVQLNYYMQERFPNQGKYDLFYAAVSGRKKLDSQNIGARLTFKIKEYETTDAFFGNNCEGHDFLIQNAPYMHRLAVWENQAAYAPDE